ncbi:hypothetical protein QUF56_09450 [Ureibacillus composti]|nr:hypothetical protein [Ureibacillus composti]
MNPEYKMALELAKAFIQNSNVKPVFSSSRLPRDDGSENLITYALNDTRFTFEEIVTHFYDNIVRMNNYYS